MSLCVTHDGKNLLLENIIEKEIKKQQYYKKIPHYENKQITRNHKINHKINQPRR
jgi:hypothetical protein